MGRKRRLRHPFRGVRQHYREETLPKKKVRNGTRTSATLWAGNVALDTLSEGFGNIIARKRCRRERVGMARGLRRHFGRETSPWTPFRRGSATLSQGNVAGGKGAEWHEDFGDTLGGKRRLGHPFGGVRQHYRKETLPEGKGRNGTRTAATLRAESVALDIRSEGVGNIIGRKRCRNAAEE